MSYQAIYKNWPCYHCIHIIKLYKILLNKCIESYFLSQPMWDYYTHTHTKRRGRINVEQNSLKRKYAITIRGNVVRERKCYTKGTEARFSSNTITTPTPDVSRRPGENLHQVSQALPPFANGLVGEGLNKPPNSQE